MRITINGVSANTGSWVGNSFGWNSVDWLGGQVGSMPVVAATPPGALYQQALERANEPLHLYRGPS